jgi:pimeloyl-ACP methyl ester carboxylesterase
MGESKKKASVVLAHGAWADGSSWAEVIKPLQAKGLNVLAAPLPLMSLFDDVAVLENALERIEGPVILAAHAYAGAVIGACRSDKVQALVFIAALTPDEGETVGEVFTREKPHPEAPHLAPDSRGIVWMPNDRFAAAFSRHATPEQAALLSATQRPIAVACLEQKSTAPAWRIKPSWYLVAQEDRMINPATQLFLARRMNARTRVEKVDHTPLVSAPGLVVEMILEALASISSNS